MSLKSSCWTLNGHGGVRKRTIADATRGDSTVEVFFVTEADAWRAEAERADRQAEQYERDATRERERAGEARANVLKCEAGEAVAK